jgi:hypothetical protein
MQIFLGIFPGFVLILASAVSFLLFIIGSNPFMNLRQPIFGIIFLFMGILSLAKGIKRPKSN